MTDSLWLRRSGYGLLCVLSVAVAGYAYVAYSLVPLGNLVHPDMKPVFEANRGVILLHIYASALALLIGPLQFHSGLRHRYRPLHRWLGRCYLGFGVGLGGLAGLYMAALAFGGMVAKVGFTFLALGWLYTGLRAYLAIRRGEVARHQRWMVLNFSLTLAAVTLRLYIPSSALLGIAFETAYPVIAWLCWVPNLTIALWWTTQNSRTSSPAQPL